MKLKTKKITQLFASKYQLYLPTEKELISEIEKQKEEYKENKLLETDSIQ